MCGFCNVWLCVCMGFVMCAFWQYVYYHSSATLTEVFPCLFLSCKANAKVKLAKTGHGTHYSQLVFICFLLLLFVFSVLFVSFYVLMCVNKIAVDK